ncbi:hypothetical protein FKP32DRAFT_1625008 [Trametes sanguinea]|nr:hypothetical protein FKP32DRAFT_1625008 [Trametes sanguinea]
MALCENSIEIDDFDENIHYSGPWQSFSDQSYGFNGTRHVATAPGLSANFKFNGKSLSTCLIVTGIIGSNGTLPMPPTTFILDGHFTQMNRSATTGTPFPGAPEFSQSPFYIATTVLEGEHELIITNLGANASMPLMLDGFIITPPGGDDGGRGPGVVAANASSASASMLSSTTPVSSSSSSAIATASSASDSTSHSDTSAIAGGVIGGVVGLLLLALAGIFVWRKFVRLSRNDPEVLSDIRPFAAWRGGATIAAGGLPANGSAVRLGTVPVEKPKVSPTRLAPAGSASATSGSCTSLHGPGSCPPVLPDQNDFFYEDPKARPPDYTP